MESLSSESESQVNARNSLELDSDIHDFTSSETKSEVDFVEFSDSEAGNLKLDHSMTDPEEEIESEMLVYGFKQNNPRTKTKKIKKKKKKAVFLEGYVETSVSRTKSLTDEDLDELKGCLDLGFGFSYEEIPELCNTLPALELCYSMSQKFLDDKQTSPAFSPSRCSPASGPIANWRISSPGDHPEEVKARLKYWAQAVACTVRLCS